MSDVRTLHDAVKRGDLDQIRRLLDANRTLANARSETYARGTYPLHVAAEFGHADAARLLLEYGATVSLLDEENAAVARLGGVLRPPRGRRRPARRGVAGSGCSWTRRVCMGQHLFRQPTVPVPGLERIYNRGVCFGSLGVSRGARGRHFFSHLRQVWQLNCFPHKQMAAYPLPAPAETDEGIVAHVGRLLHLECELALAELRELLVTAALTIALGAAGAFTLIAALVVGLAAVLAPLFAARWEHLAVAGGITLVISVGAVAWSTWRLTTLPWPRLTLITLEETWRWLEAQLKSRLRLR